MTLTTLTLSAVSFLYSCIHACFDSFLTGEHSSLRYCSYFVSLSCPLMTDSSFNYKWAYCPALVLAPLFLLFLFIRCRLPYPFWLITHSLWSRLRCLPGWLLSPFTVASHVLSVLSRSTFICILVALVSFLLLANNEVSPFSLSSVAVGLSFSLCSRLCRLQVSG